MNQNIDGVKANNVEGTDTGIIKKLITTHFLETDLENKERELFVTEEPPLSKSMSKSFPTRDERVAINNDSVITPHVIAMVGLPARGKTYIAKKLTRYLGWIGINTKVFNLGEYRRHVAGDYQNHDFFRADNIEAMAIRNKCALVALDDACDWIKNKKGNVAVFDATNSTSERRELIYDIVVRKNGLKLFFVESICFDPQIIEQNIVEVKVNSPDYLEMKKQRKDKGEVEKLILDDFRQRIAHYQEKYQTLDETIESHLSFMKIFDTGKKVVVYNSRGHLQSRVVYFLMNIHITPRSIYFTRHGESEENLKGLIGGDGILSSRGREYSKLLAYKINKKNLDELRVWTSCMKRSIQTCKDIIAPQERWKALNEINAGECELMSYNEIATKFPEQFEQRDQDKFHFRYNGGESYEDLVARLEPVIMELERQGNVLVVSHQAVLRCLLAYFLDKSTDELPYIEVPLHNIIKLTPVAYGCKREDIPIEVPAVNTHRLQPTKFKKQMEVNSAANALKLLNTTLKKS